MRRLAIVLAIGCSQPREEAATSAVEVTGELPEVSTGDAASSSSSGADPGETSSESGGSSTSSGGSSSGSSGEVGDPCGGADILCDDFEDGLDDGWSHVGNPALMPTIDGSRAHGGGQSLAFAGTDNWGTFVYPSEGLPAVDNRVYVRAWISFGKPTVDMGGHVSMIVGATQPENGTEVRFGASRNFANSMMMLDVNFIGSGPEYTQFSNGDITGGGGSQRPGIALEADTWYCVEALFDGGAHELRMWIDGVEVEGLHVTDWGAGLDDWSPSYDVVKLGGQNYSGDLGPVWYDDVAISTQPIAC